MSPPVGPAGILECNGDEPSPHAEAPRLFRVSGAYSVFATDLAFVSGEDAYMERRAVTASLGYRYSDTISLQVGAGATLGGRFVFGKEHFSFDPGWIASFAGSWKIVGERRNDAFLIAGGAFAASGGETKDIRGASEYMLAFDLRLSVMAGKTFFDVLSPYLVARAFGGPVIWHYRAEDRLAGDKYHFQVGMGLLVSLPEHLDVFAEGVPLGERAAVVGLGYSF